MTGFTCPLCGGALHSMNENGIWYKECAECGKRFDYSVGQQVVVRTSDRTKEAK